MMNAFQKLRPGVCGVAKLAVGARDTATDAAAHSTEISARSESVYTRERAGDEVVMMK